MNIDFIKVLRKALYITVISLLLFSLMSLTILITKVYSLSIQFDYDGLIRFMSFFKPFKSVFTATFITLSTYIGLETLSSKIIVDEGKALLEIRSLFNQEELREVNQNLRPIAGKWTNENLESFDDIRNNWHKIDAYIEVFELANILIDKKVLTMETFKDHFGYWLENILENEWIRSKVRNEMRGWSNFKGLCAKLNLEIKEANFDLLVKLKK